MAKVGTKKVTAVRRQLNGLSVAGQGTLGMLPKSPPPAPESLDGVHTRVKGSRLTAKKTYVPVLSVDREVLMPTTAARARKWIKSGKATPFFRGQMFCVRLNVKSGATVQSIAVGIDPGSKWEGYTIKSESHTYLNIQTRAVDWVSHNVQTKRMMRRQRRQKKTPYRKNRHNRHHGGMAPSTRARWFWKIRIAKWLNKLFPVDCFVVEDIKAKTLGQPRWDKTFSPLQSGKKWFYKELNKIAWVETLTGYETKKLRENAKLKKYKKSKVQEFSAHCVDSWVLANWYTGGHFTPDNRNFIFIFPLRFRRRQLHYLQPLKGGVRPKYGSTRSLGFKRGSIVFHKKHGYSYVGGTSENRISLHRIKTGKRFCQNVRKDDCTFLSYNSWRLVL